MYTGLGRVVLQDGKTVGAGVVAGPDREWAGRMEALLQHKGGLWNWQNSQVLRADTGVDARFFVLHRRGTPFANVMTVDLQGAGLLGHVWTQPEHRRRGAAAALMKLAMADFAARGGRALFLGTGYDSPAYHLYTRFGFRGIEPRSGSMAFYTASRRAFERDYFAPGLTRIERLDWRHWPAAPALFLGDFPGRIRCLPLGIIGRTFTEGPLLPALRDEADRRGKGEPSAVSALVSAGSGAVLGLAAWGWHRLWPQTCLVDVYCHPDHWRGAPELLASLELPAADRCLAYADASCEAKRRVLAAAGFAPVARFARRVRADGTDRDRIAVTELERKTNARRQLRRRARKERR